MTILYFSVVCIPPCASSSFSYFLFCLTCTKLFLLDHFVKKHAELIIVFQVRYILSLHFYKPSHCFPESLGSLQQCPTHNSLCQTQHGVQAFHTTLPSYVSLAHVGTGCYLLSSFSDTALTNLSSSVSSLLCLSIVQFLL